MANIHVSEIKMDIQVRELSTEFKGEMDYCG